jgi:hypothetical protein
MLVLNGQAIAVVVIAIVGAVGTAMWGWFSSVHGDLRNRDGTTLSTRESWNHIIGLLSYFVLGLVVSGVLSVIVIASISAVG